MSDEQTTVECYCGCGAMIEYATAGRSDPTTPAGLADALQDILDGHCIARPGEPHYWLQYMNRAGDALRFRELVRGGEWEHQLVPDGFYCPWCRARRAS